MTTDSTEAARERIGDLERGELRSDGDDRLCAYGHFIPSGWGLYWPANPASQYDDSDPHCLLHAVDRAVRRGEINREQGDQFIARYAVDGDPA